MLLLIFIEYIIIYYGNSTLRKEMMKMHLDVYSTHMELYPYKKDDFPIIEDMFVALTTTDFSSLS